MSLSLSLSALQCESKNLPDFYLTFFPKRLGIFSPDFTCPLYVPVYAELRIFIQLPATLTKLRHIKRDLRHMLKLPNNDRLKLTLGGRT